MKRRWLFLLLFGAVTWWLVVPTRGWAQLENAPLDRLVELAQADEVNDRRDASYEIVRREAFNAQTIALLATLLDDRDPQVRFHALIGLAHAGPQAEAAIDKLVELLNDRDPQVRFRAADALGKIGTAALPALLQAWEKSSSRARVEIARAIGIMGPSAAEAVEVLRGGLDHEDRQVRSEAAAALLSVAPNDEAIHQRLVAHEDPDLRCMGLFALAGMPQLSPSQQQWLWEGLQDSEPVVREAAIVAIAKSRLPAEKKEEAVLRALKDDEETVRLASLAAIPKAGLPPTELAKLLLASLAEAETPETAGALLKGLVRLPQPLSAEQVQVVLAVGARGQLPAEDVVALLRRSGPQIVSTLLQSLEHHPQLEAIVAATLASIGPPAQEAVFNCLNHPLGVVRRAALLAIGDFPGDAFPAARIMAMIESDSDPGVRSAAIKTAVERAAEEESLRHLVVKAVNDPHPAVRVQAVMALTALDIPRDRRNELLRARVEDADANVRLALAQAVTSLAERELISPILGRLAKDAVAEVRLAAIGGLSRWRPEDVDDRLRDLLRDAIADESPQVCVAAIETAAQWQLEDPVTVGRLANQLRPPEQRQVAALEALQRLGKKAEPALPKIEEALADDSPTVRSAAIAAVAAIAAEDVSYLTKKLIQALDDPAWEVRQVAAQRLGTLGPAAKLAVPKLFTMLASEEDSDFASGALREIDAAPPEAIDLFMQHLDSDDRRTAFFAIFLLGKIGPDAKRVLPELQKRLAAAEQDSSSSAIRTRFIRQAIEAIRGEE
ncbi:MAG: hypothetical protein KatS3mg111_2498 [Pirellulaceae bacterium]|nr:MAG: hypothetical protein KatS3mg111_2498 [Pirellulaceae bacterium]